jgi:hypothetical protein
VATLSTAARNAAVDAIVALLTSFQFRTSGGGIITDLEGAAWNAASDGTATGVLNQFSSPFNNPSFCVLPGDIGQMEFAFFVLTASVGVVGSGEDVEFATVNMQPGQLLLLASIALTMPAS